MPVLLRDCLKTMPSQVGGYKTLLWRLQWKLNALPAFGVRPLCLKGECGPADVWSIKAHWGWHLKPKYSRRRRCCLPTDPVLPFLLMSGHSETGAQFDSEPHLAWRETEGETLPISVCFEPRVWECCPTLCSPPSLPVHLHIIIPTINTD